MKRTIATDIFRNRETIEYGVACYDPALDKHVIVHRDNRYEVAESTRNRLKDAGADDPIIVKRTIVETAFEEWKYRCPGCGWEWRQGDQPAEHIRTIGTCRTEVKD